MLISADFSGGRLQLNIVLELYFKTVSLFLTTLSDWVPNAVGSALKASCRVYPLVSDQSCSVKTS